MSFGGQFRDWTLFAQLNADWFRVFTTVCALPTEPGLHVEALLWIARANARLALTKFSLTERDAIVLELESRAPLLTGEDVQNLVWFLQTTAEREYQELFRIVSGQARLDALSQAFARDRPERGAPVSE